MLFASGISVWLICFSKLHVLHVHTSLYGFKKTQYLYTYRYGDPLLRSCVRAHWKSNWPILELMIFISRREKEKERNILKDFDIDLSADLFIPVIATLIDFHNFWLYHYTGVNYKFTYEQMTIKYFLWMSKQDRFFKNCNSIYLIVTVMDVDFHCLSDPQVPPWQPRQQEMVWRKSNPTQAQVININTMG